MAAVANASVDAHDVGVCGSATRLCTPWVMVLGRGPRCLRSLSVLGAACARRGLGKCVWALTRRGAGRPDVGWASPRRLRAQVLCAAGRTRSRAGRLQLRPAALTGSVAGDRGRTPAPTRPESDSSAGVATSVSKPAAVPPGVQLVGQQWVANAPELAGLSPASREFGSNRD